MERIGPGMFRTYDSTVPGFLPWFERCTPRQLKYQIARYRRALRFCVGRAADLRPHLAAFIERLEALQWQREGRSGALQNPPGDMP